MKIRDKSVLVYDIEVFQNIFHCTVKDTETGQLYLFEISDRKNQIQELVNFFKQFDNVEGSWNKSYATDYQFNTKVIFAGYNNIHYDNPIINYCIEFFSNSSYTYDVICNSIFNLSNVITMSKDNVDRWKRWKYANNFLTLDLLTMLYSQALRVSLKEMQVTMQYKNVEEFVVDWHQDLPEKDMNRLISYNINDVESTEELLYRCKSDLELRVSIENEYYINCLSLDGVNTGMKILEQEYIKHTGISRQMLEQLRSPCDQIDLEKVIFPWISFDTPILKDLLKNMKQLHNVSPGRKGYENTFVFGGMKVTVGVGGIHGDCGIEIIKPNEDEILLDSDVSSLYPSMIIEHNLYPPHLGKEFLETYTNIRTRRLEAKKNKIKVVDKTLKLSLNGLSGNLQNEHSWCYSPFTVMQIRINGQLLLLKLSEQLLSIGCKLHQINTDGVLYTCKKAKYDELQRILKDWENLTKLKLETEEFIQFYQLAINDYFGLKSDNTIKKKGFFLTNIELGKGLSPKIIPEAIINYFIDGIPVEETIKSCRDIRKFLQAEKTGKQWTVEYNEQVQQRTNRFYVSNKGYYLWKWTYYIVQCLKIIEQLKPKQLNLFDFNKL